MSTPHAKTAKVVGKDELSHLVAAKAQVHVKEADAMLDAFMETIREHIAKGRQVRLIGFGSWRLRSVAARTITSIRGGTPIHIPAGKGVGFRTGSQLAEAAKTATPAKKRPAKIRCSCDDVSVGEFHCSLCLSRGNTPRFVLRPRVHKSFSGRITIVSGGGTSPFSIPWLRGKRQTHASPDSDASPMCAGVPLNAC